MMGPERPYSLRDRLLLCIDSGLRSITGQALASGHTYPATELPIGALPATRVRRKSIALMRVNHVGEICAQGLYHGQAIAASTALQGQLLAAAREEGDHLLWCQRRVRELDGRCSYLVPFWYLGAATIGLAAGLAKDSFSLGFLAETEAQVGRHLQRHMLRLPSADARSKAILQQMISDEAQHQHDAEQSGGKPLPPALRQAMQIGGRIMTTLSYRV